MRTPARPRTIGSIESESLDVSAAESSMRSGGDTGKGGLAKSAGGGEGACSREEQMGRHGAIESDAAEDCAEGED